MNIRLLTALLLVIAAACAGADRSLAETRVALVIGNGAYQNATWVIGTAKCGVEEGSAMVGQSAIIAPSGEIIAQAVSLEDEIITARCDLDLGKRYRETIFNFAKHREPEAYRLIVERKGAIPPPEE